MTVLKSNYRNNIQQINYLSLLLFIFWLPLKDDYLPVILALWIFTWLLEGNFKTRIKDFSNKPFYFAILIYFILTAVALLYTENIELGIFHMQEKLSMVFFPIFLAGSNIKVKNNYRTILLIFVLGNLVASLYCIINAFTNSIIIENGKYIFHYYISSYDENTSFWQLINTRYSNFAYTYLSVFKHPAYFSIYLLFSIIIIIFQLRSGHIVKRVSKILFIILIIFFLFMIYLLQSCAGIITLGIFLIFLPLVEIQKKINKKYLYIVYSIILIFIYTIFSNSPISKNFSELRKSFSDPHGFSINKSDVRIQLWYSTSIVIGENFWLGTSPADLSKELVKKYSLYGFVAAEKDQLNTHNQFLESFAGLGIVGFLTLIIILCYGFIISIKKFNYLLFFLLLILTISFFFESILNRMAGVLFMMFFISLFVFAKIPEFNTKK